MSEAYMHDFGGVATGALLIIAGACLAFKTGQLAAGIEKYYANIQGRQKRMYRGRLAWLTWGVAPTRRQSRWLAGALALGAIGVGVVFLIQSV